ncbi:putative SOS response-associated peptidase YedK [compost metagenome]
MVDIHARRPVALPPDIARCWADPWFPTVDARALLNEGLPEEAFSWHPVRQEVGNTKYQLPDAIDPI